MQKAIIVLLDLHKASVLGGEQVTLEALQDLNNHLKEGWIVKHSSALGGTGHQIASSLVILEK